MYVRLLYEILREKSLIENRILSNINLTLTNVKRYQRYAKVVHGSVNAPNILPRKE